MLLGRMTERERIGELLAAADAGRSGALVLRGEPGIGKTALLDFARTASKARVTLEVRGNEMEAGIPYVGLADLLRPVAGYLDRIPEPQRAALAGVLAIGPPQTGDRFALAAATLNLLGALAAEGSVLVLVDDVHWLDRSSVDAFGFAARRLAAEGVAMLFAARPEGEGQVINGIEEMRLGGLDARSAEQLVETHAVHDLGRDLRRRLIAETGGNPLALIELTARTEPERLMLWARGVEPVPVGYALEEGFGRQLAELGESVQRALVLLAVLASVPASVYQRALAEQGLSLAELAPAEEAGLVVVAGAEVAFRHPLVRAAAHSVASPPQRRAAHEAAARALAASEVPNAIERQAWHQVAAGHAPDPEFAAVLVAAADQEFGRGNYAVAGHLFERSAQLLAGGPEAVAQLVRAADSVRLLGGIDESADLLERALQAVTDADVELGIRFALLRLDMWRRSPAVSRDRLVRLAEQVTDPGFAALMLADAAVASADLDDPALAGRLVDRALELCGEAAAAPHPVRIVASLMRTLSGRPADGRELLDEGNLDVDGLDALARELVDQLVLIIGLCHFALEDVVRARELVRRAVDTAREANAVGVLPFRLGRLAWIEYWAGNWNEALALAYDSIRLGEDTGWLNQVVAGLVIQARIEAGLGRAEDCRKHADAAKALVTKSGLQVNAALADRAVGLLELGRGNNQAAITHLSAVAAFAEAGRLVDTPLLSWTGDLVEALAREGRVKEARDALDSVAARTTSADAGGPTARAVAARCRALLDPDRYHEHLTEALVLHGQGSAPFELARTQLVFGEQLRRRRRRAEAREVLLAALATFERLGAVDWAARTRAELRTAGDRSTHDPGPASSATLTPQELQVALAAADGYSNREVATRLFLSVKTVEFHLSNVYRKLGVRGRTQLARLLTQEERPE